MPRIRCRYEDCVFLEEGYCGAAAIELEPDTGCLTYSRVDESESAEDEWEEDEFDEEEEELYDEEEDEDLWDEDDEDDDEY
ncbi:MAG: hypothetical protein A2W37_10940 [Chloroflexi bacterium RBG_16_63_12]|jgi:hypothetical protein|nr:hypothetical protein [Anaerolineales bacterium]MBM2848676.1 hypothetical protein [Anaerolineales bacterium]OGO46417.1 MAG: hypothetical protein A2W37_10940 [Chloroflexi bacterium RBG_16_63_12]